MNKQKLIIIALLTLLMLIGCRDYHYFMDMRISPSVDAQELDVKGKRKGAMLPPENSVAYKTKKYYISKNDMASADKLKNPYSGDQNYLKVGKSQYKIFCSPCHGMTGLGDGTVKKKWDLIPSIAASDSRANGYKIGRVYHIITAGFSTMASYKAQIPSDKDRWFVAEYVKYLQKKNSK